MRPVTVNPQSGYLMVDNTAKNFEFDKEHSQQCRAFVDKLREIPESLFMVADFFAQKFDIKNDENLFKVFESIKTEAKKRLMTAVDEQKKAKFALCLLLWKNHDNPQDRDLIRIINNVIDSL